MLHTAKLLYKRILIVVEENAIGYTLKVDCAGRFSCLTGVKK